LAFLLEKRYARVRPGRELLRAAGAQ